MTRTSLAGVFSAIVLAAGCARSGQSAADTASSTAAQAASVPVDTLAATSESTTSVSTVRRKSSGKKSSGPVRPKTGTTNSVRSGVTSPRDSILGRDSVIRFPIRRLPTASSSPVRR
ncbi:MAG: hypothetical protein M3037_08420 [Gemmatimonadota bacterium]|nr:hypothetical protein [Gemmatimonadota bacterium]